MRHLFIDTNIIIDFLANREPFAIDAALIFESFLTGKTKLYVSAISYNNIYYLLRKQQTSHSYTIKLLSQISEMLDIISVSKHIIQNAMQSNYKDFEDAIQYFCAISISKIEIIVTRNVKDFKPSTLPVLTPAETLTLLNND